MFKASFQIGNANVVIATEDKSLFALAQKRLYLQKERQNKISQTILFVKDNTVDNLIQTDIAENAVHIEKKKDQQGRTSWLMKVFNQFCVSIEPNTADSLKVRYSKHAVHSYLLDDVLQAAIDDVLRKQNGFILHGACMVKENKAIALLGPSGSGKSTSAFNLMRGGYQCFADDAVIVTKHNNSLWVWPFCKEISLRPLSYNLFKQQGLEFTQYRRDGKKYYFKSHREEYNNGAPLTAVSLIEVAGENQSSHTKISNQQFVDKMTAEKKYFSFINRDNHMHYLDLVCCYVPAKYISKMGSDLNTQIVSIDKLLDLSPTQFENQNTHFSSREEKLNIIKAAWLDESNADIEKIIPLLAQSDLRVFETTLAFLQNYSIAQIAVFNAQENLEQHTKFPDVLKAYQWQNACQNFSELLSTEMLNEYATGWLTSAPILYAFLQDKLLPEQRNILKNSWLIAAKNLQKIIALKKNHIRCDVETFIQLKTNALCNEDIIVTIKQKSLKNNQAINKSISELSQNKNRIFINTDIKSFINLADELIAVSLKYNPYTFSLTNEYAL